MHETDIVDVLVGLFASFIGVVSLVHAVSIWSVRNGSILTVALCGKLTSFFLWSVLVLSTTLYQWHFHIMRDNASRNLTLSDRLVLSIMQAFIVLWVIPMMGKSKH